MSLENSKNTEMINDAAVRLFKSQGYANVSVNEICKDAGVSRSSFYTIFSGKKDIIVYILSAVKQDFEATLSAFVDAENDFERMWSLCDRYLSIALDFGPELTGSLFCIELDEPVGIFESVKLINDWLIKLAGNCQTSGIIRSKIASNELVPLSTNLIIEATYEWCRCKGSFSLRDRAREYIETIFDVNPEYRWKK